MSSAQDRERPLHHLYSVVGHLQKKAAADSLVGAEFHVANRQDSTLRALVSTDEGDEHNPTLATNQPTARLCPHRKVLCSQNPEASPGTNDLAANYSSSHSDNRQNQHMARAPWR